MTNSTLLLPSSQASQQLETVEVEEQRPRYSYSARRKIVIAFLVITGMAQVLSFLLFTAFSVSHVMSLL
jgi:hypothetical protein